jgi:hypothetical protein
VLLEGAVSVGIEGISCALVGSGAAAKRNVLRVILLVVGAASILLGGGGGRWVGATVEER